MKPYFDASNVAALIGRHAYRTRAEAKLLVLSKAAEKSFDNTLTDDVRKAMKQVRARIAVARLDKSKAVEAACPAFKTAVERAAEAHTDVDLGPSESLARELAEAAELANQNAEKASQAHQVAVEAVRAKPNDAEAVQNAREAEVVAADTAARAAVISDAQNPKALEAIAKEAVQKRRGRDEEDSLLDVHAKRQNTDVKQRNTHMVYLRTESYVIGGRCDGVDSDGVIVELKNRRNWFAEAPEYDIIQLRVYMKAYGAQKGRLVEFHQRGVLGPRETDVVHDETEWAAIHDRLVATANQLRAIRTADDVEALLDEIDAE